MDRALEQRLRSGYAAFAAGDLDAAMESLAPDVSFVNPEYALEGGVREGFEGVRGGLQALLDQFEFESVEVEEILQGENAVMLVVHIRAKGRGSGVPLDQRFAHVWTSLEDGRGVTFQWFVSREEGLTAAGLS